MIVGGTLAALAIGLVPLAITLVQMRVFYAMKDARTPALINAIMVAVRIPLLIVCAGLDESLIIPGMAIATSISSCAARNHWRRSKASCGRWSHSTWRVDASNSACRCSSGRRRALKSSSTRRLLVRWSRPWIKRASGRAPKLSS